MKKQSKKIIATAAMTVVVGLAVSGGCARKNRKQNSAPAPQAEAPRVDGQVVVSAPPSLLPKLRKEFQVEALDAAHDMYIVSGPAVSGHETEVAATLARESGVAFAEPNYVYRIDDIMPRDPQWLSLWGLKNIGQDSPAGTEGRVRADIDAIGAWAVSTGSQDVVVAIIDTGIDYTHPDLKGNIWVNTAEANGQPGIDEDGNGYADDIYGWDFTSTFREKPYHGQLGAPDPMDDNGHGTHVAGTIGAVGNNGIGVTGVNWKVRMMGLKFLDKDGSGTSTDLYRALMYAASRKVDVINASFGGGGASKLVAAALNEIERSGALFVAAAGNEGSDNDQMPHFPSSYPNDGILAVAATDNRDHIADFSCFGRESVDIAAPGVAIMSTYPVKLAAEEEDTNPYRAFSGTSMATPHVVGAAALVLAADPSLKGKPVALKKRLLESAEWSHELSSKVLSGARLNVGRAVRKEMGNSPIFEAQWLEEPYELATPRYSTERLDSSWTIRKPGAKALQIHVKRALIDQPYDAAMLFDGLYRPVTSLGQMMADEWLPIVAGDTAHLSFSNALVVVQKSKWVTVKDPSTIPEDEFGGICFKEGEESYSCLVYEKPSDTFANFGSDGVEIDRIRYIPGVTP